MGDKFENIQSSTIINRSSVKGNIEGHEVLIDDELKKAIIKISTVVEDQNNPVALATLKEFQTEIQKPNRKPELIKQYWSILISMTPKISKLIDVVKKIESVIF